MTEKVLDKEAVADVQFVDTSLSRVTLGKDFAECFLGSTECLKHSAKQLCLVVSQTPHIPFIRHFGTGPFAYVVG